MSAYTAAQLVREDFKPHTLRTAWNESHGRDVIGERVTRVSLVVHFGLHYIRGNSAPYFSITADGYENGRESFGGCCHDVILQQFPALADVVALHLSDIDGAPSYADGNGFYWLAGIVDMGERYHGGSGDYGKGPLECARIAADHFRITEREAIALAGRCNTARKAGGIASAKRVCTEFTDAQRARWKSEARAVVAKYAIGVHGDMHKTAAETLALFNA